VRVGVSSMNAHSAGMGGAGTAPAAGETGRVAHPHRLARVPCHHRAATDGRTQAGRGRIEAVPQACHKQRFKVDGQRSTRVCVTTARKRTDAILSWAERHMSRSACRAGDRDRTGEAASRCSGQRPVEWCGSRRHCCPRRPGGPSTCRPPGPGRLAGPVMRDGARRDGHCPAILPGSLRRDSVSLRSRPRRPGLHRSAACGCRPTVRAAQRGPRQRRSRPSPC
jgi:hypothetical protein